MSPPSFRRLRRLRDGYASIVWHCIDDRIKRNVAVKFLANVKDAKDEVKILGHFCHPNVINVVDFIKWSDSFGIVMHEMDMDLRQFMEHENYDSTNVCDISKQCAEGLHHVHSLRILHADVKPENIGISITKIEGRRLIIHVRLLDFGSSKFISEIKLGMQIRSTLQNQAPEKRLGMFHHPGDIYEMGVVFQELKEHSNMTGLDAFYDRLVADMLQDEFQLRPTSHQLLARLGDPLHALWNQISSMVVGGVDAMDISDLVDSADPLTFLWRDLLPRMQYIVKLGDSLTDRAFYLLFKTAQSEIIAFNESGSEVTLLHYVYPFHAKVDTSWWTQLFYCMALHVLSVLPYFSLSDIMKVKLLAISSVPICEQYVRGIFLNYTGCSDWCSGHRWGVDCAEFDVFVGRDSGLLWVEE